MAKSKKKTKRRGLWASRTAKKQRAWYEGTDATLRPPPKLTLSEWADAHFYLSAESAAEPGRWKTLPYQRGVMDAITDPAVTRVSMIKSARVGFTKLVNAAIGYYIDSDPCPIMVVQPTVEDAEGYSKEEIAPMLRDCKVLAGRVSDAAKTSEQTILHKVFPGGSLSMVGANSGRGFRRVSRRVVIFDEVDGYPPSAGSEGDQIKLGERRAEYYWNRKIIAGSTPLVAGASRIEAMFEAGDRRRYYVPCPHCGHMDFLRFSERDDDGEDGGHVMRWPKDRPEEAHFICPRCGCVIEETSKRAMIEAGEWRAEGAFNGHASFHIWAAYSLSPNATWGQLATEFIEAKSDTDKLKTFVNTVLGQTWKEKGEAPDYERLHNRRESYAIGTVPVEPVFLTCGVDVQKDRFVYEVVAWARNKESWSVDAGELHGDTALESTWLKLDELLARTYADGAGREWSIAMMAVDSGYNTQTVYGWCRQKPASRVMAIKGDASARMLVGSPSRVDVLLNGKKLRRGYKVWPVGVDIAKAELYGMLGLRRGDGEPPPGYCHFPEYGEEFFKQITAEQLIETVNKKLRRKKYSWALLPNRENHHLDARVYARAAASVLGIDRMPKKAKGGEKKAASATPQTQQETPRAQELAPSSPPKSTKKPSFWKERGEGRGRGWFGKRR